MINCWRCQVSEDSDVCGDVRLIEVADIVAGDVCGGNVSDVGGSDVGEEMLVVAMLVKRCWW